MGIMYKLMKHRHLNMDINTKPATKTKSDKCRLLATEGGHHYSGVDVKVNEDDNDSDTTPQHKHHGEKVEGMIEKRFTAEHILQLCKFLAEKSKRNKNLHKQQQSPKKLTKLHKSFQFQAMDYEDANEADEADDSDNVDNMSAMMYDNEHDDNDNDVVGIYQNQALPLLSHNKSAALTTTTVLSSRLSPDINALNISTTVARQHQNPSLQQQHLQPEQLHQQHYHHHHQQQQHQPPLQAHHQQGKRDILLKIRHQIFERRRLREKGYEPQAINAVVASQVWRPW